MRKMRLGYINHRPDVLSKWMVQDLERAGIVVDETDTWEDFESEFFHKNKYDGLLLHPGVNLQKETILIAQETGIPFAFLTESPRDYLVGRITLFSYGNTEKIIQYFNSKSQ